MITTAAQDVNREITDADPKLYNHDLAPVKEQTWKAYNIFAFWMSDVHSVGGYVFAGSLFALGLTSWQVLLCLLLSPKEAKDSRAGSLYDVTSGSLLV
jgi:cytosine/uracil/thiamine/allantoin permease